MNYQAKKIQIDKCGVCMRKYLGDKAFYKMVMLIAIPIMIQNGITNFVNLLDNIMIGRLGTEQMSGVAISNQLIFVFNVSIFGAISGAGIFGAQFFGSKNYEGMRNTFRFKFMTCIVMGLIGMVVFYLFRSNLINLYLSGSVDAGDPMKTLQYGEQYLVIMLLGLIPFAISQTYSSTLREAGQTLLPMISGIVAVFVNLVFNYVLIYGAFGLPALGVQGAAIATVISRFVECTIIIIWTHKHALKNEFIQGVYKTFRIPRHLVLQVTKKGAPLLINEFLWSGGMATLLQCYSVRSTAVVAGMNISNTIVNVFNIVFIAMGSAVGILVGQQLGSGDMKKAKDTAVKMIFFSVMSCILIGAVMAASAPFFPKIYKTEPLVQNLATSFILIAAVYMPFNAFTHAAYFTMRSGGKTGITFLFDSVFMWLVNIPVAYFLSRYTSIPIVPLYLMCQGVELIKCVIGYILVKKGVWLHNIVTDEAYQ